ncbi:MAG: hypothetical protein WKF78_07030 [Candidatus Limnocylindrales bacterium]
MDDLRNAVHDLAQCRKVRDVAADEGRVAGRTVAAEPRAGTLGCRPGQVVEHGHGRAARHESFDELRADEAGPTRDQHASGHVTLSFWTTA